MGIFLTVFPLILLGLMVAWGFLIGTRNVIIRAAGVGVSLIAAIASVIVLKDLGFSSISPLLSSFLSGTELGDSILDFLASTETLGDAMVSIGGAIAAPLVFAVIFVIFAIITWVIGWIVGLIIMLVSSNKDRKKRSPAVIIPCAAVQALLTAFVLITPLAAYSTCAKTVIVRSTEYDTSSLVQNNDVISAIDEIDSSPAVAVYRVVGGNAVCKWMTSFKIGEEKSDLVSEADAIGRVVGDVLYLSDSKVTEYGEDEADALEDLSESISDSVILPALAGEVVYSATDAWLNEDGSFFGVPAPNLDEMAAELFDETFIHLLEIFHEDARDHEAFCADLKTVANSVVILAEDGIFRTMGEDSGALIDKLSGGETVRKLVAEFGSNPGFKILIGDITNIGMRAIGTALSIPENADEVYSDFAGSIAEELTALNSSNKSDEGKCAELAEAVKEAFTKSGVTVELDDEVVKLYAKMMIDDFGSYEEVTKEDISEFFRVYSEVSNSIDTEKVNMECGGVTLLSGSESYEYSSETYAGKTLEELQNQSGAGVLAEIMKAILAAQDSGKADDEEVRKIIEEIYFDYAEAVEKDTGAAKDLADSISLTGEAITSYLISATANMCSAESMAESSSIVTVADLLVDAEKLLTSLDSAEAVEREAEAIGRVFSSVADIVSLIGETEGSVQINDFSSVAANIGDILDCLSETGAFGAENSGKLMTAVMQCESVRDAANIDMNTATEIAKAATESEDGKVNYKEAMVGIATGANVADKLSDENKELTREDIRELLDNMTPQTAKVLNAYMTEERIAGFGVPESKLSLSTEMVNDLLTEMGNKEKYSSDYESEIDGITTLFDLMNAATVKNSDGQAIFDHDGESGMLNTNAYDFTNTVLASDMVCNALLKSFNKNGTLMYDPFGLNLDKTSADYIALEDALDKHLSESSDNSDSYRERVNAVGALFGVEK